ncbi:P-loop NTPase fold protein [Nodularia sphaerocarpa]|uniref:P-loop NTPase fold protein n=1 Tax=Nodularia sphaerocarpa TaxID=137816 RepID=UPI001EFA378F|nr:P-loop NTPase fold protein [Nodularia sphaerocarpa]MDB9374842.1 P-loop NTPase fold protein [Nodularia sphaerocarpa CS-585]MDB9379984.1 P-loop NTPase fold protein [Nodularia sphaerocarpa CS-585A2]ULP70495.1 hypothetical protein BDGGKGIB_00111 [Nodularia sphaerocarpa UHCC 0038]
MNESTNKAISGINREEAESILTRFLDNQDYKVLAVKGKWGVGKTYLVKTFLDEYTKEYYSYASVFGISSIEQLKARLIASYKGKENNNFFNKKIFSSFEFYNRNVGKLEKTPRIIDLPLSEKLSIPIAGSLISIAGDFLLEMLFNTNVKNSIVCIDDLERKSKLPLDELLGFVEYIVQELECKIILIYNEDILLDDVQSKKILDDYREKVIDIEFTLDPTVEENLDFIFKQHPDIEVIKEVFIRAKTNNIRLIRKTKWLIDELIPLMENWEPSLRNQIIQNSIIINLAKLDTDFGKLFPINVDTILSLIDSSKYVDKNNDTSEDKIRAGNLLSFLGYHAIGLELQIINLVETALFNAEDFIKKGNILNQEEQENKILEKIGIIKDKFFCGFIDNEQELVNEITNLLDNHHLYLRILDFKIIEYYASFVELDISKYEKFLLQHKLQLLEPNDCNEAYAIRAKLHKYPDLVAHLEVKKKEYKQTLNITKALSKINRNYRYKSYWFDVKDAEIEFLNSCSVDEFYKWLKGGNSDLTERVKDCLDLDLPASQNLEKAIRMLAESSRLNKIRAKEIYKIDIDIPSNTSNAS